mgnify:CR=1 FL=1
MIGNLLKRAAPTHFATPYKLGHDKTFHLLEARRGRGKSYTMSVWALECAKKKVGTVANFHLNIYWIAHELMRAGIWDNHDECLAWCEKNIRYVDTWDEIMLAYDCLVLVDEVNRLFDSQFRSKEDSVPKVVFEWLQLSRRNKITLVFAAQSMDWLNTRVRQLFDLLWRAKKEMGRGRKSLEIERFWLYGADPWSKGLNDNAQRNADYKVMIPFRKEYFRLYDTLERIIAIPNQSNYERFYDVYQHQIQLGLIPPTAPPPPRSLPWQDYLALMEGIVEPGAVTSAVREERSPAERVYGRVLN